MHEKLRVGVLINSDHIPYWAYKMLDRIQGSSYAEIILVVKNGGAPLNPTSSIEKFRKYRHILYYLALAKFDTTLKQVDPDPFASKDIRELLPAAEYLTVCPTQTRFSDYLNPGDLREIESRKLDVLIRLGFRILRGGVLNAAKYGIWSYHHGDRQTNRGGPPGFWEVLGACPVTGSTLQILTEDLDGGDVLYRSYSQTHPTLISRNKANVYWKSVSFIPRKLEELHRIGGDEFLSRVRNENRHPDYYSRRLYTVPSNLELIGLAIRHYSKYAISRLSSLIYFDQWILLYGLREHGRIPTSFWRYRKIVPPKDRFWADPFVIFRDGKYFLFVEEFVYRAEKGHISCISLTSDGTHSDPVRVLERPYHLSYPFVFSHEDTYYMIPETAENRTIELYKCVMFPDKWEFVRNIMEDIHAVDSTLHFADGKWWMFTNIRENEGASSTDELFLFHTTDPLFDNWSAHPCNPVVSDARSARPAGRVFSHNGNLYRPSQNNSKCYGYGMKINQIEALSESEYRERCVNEIEPLWDPRIIATHTFNSVEDLTVIDGLLKRAKYSG